METKQAFKVAGELQEVMNAFARRSPDHKVMVSAIRKASKNWYLVEERPWLKGLAEWCIGRPI